MQVAEYIGQFLVRQGVKFNFTVPGGGAMYLNMAFGHTDGLENIFVQHEQAAAMAAEAVARVTNVPALVCCTTGPGGTNTLTGVLGAWLDSIPMIVVSGQVKYISTARSTGLNLRAMGDQEFDITPVAAPMTKYAEMVTDPLSIKYHLEKAWHLATSGRPGPVWLDVPQDVQRAEIDLDSLVGYDSEEDADNNLPEAVSDELADEILAKIRSAKRPVLDVGNGVRIAGAYQQLQKLVDKLGIPVVTEVNSIDLIADECPYYVGRAGLIGDRAGNWAVQNSDLFFSIGSRLSARQVGYDVRSWAREAFTIVEDVDAEELKKPTIRVDLPVHADARDLIEKLLERSSDDSVASCQEWLETCQNWKKDYPVVQPAHYEESRAVNVYAFMDELSNSLPDDAMVVTGNGSACVVSSQVLRMKQDQRYIYNSGAASMGYDLPAALGACLAAGRSKTVCLSGDGSIQMNIQELQTIVFHKLPIKIFVINNGGYHSMRQTESNLFPDKVPVGIGPETGDLSFPVIERIAGAYEIPYRKADHNEDVGKAIHETLDLDGPAICEIFVVKDQKFEPKSATRKLDDGTLVSPPLEDLAPFLPREELEQIMLIPMWEG